MKKLNYEIKEKMVALAGACFWFWDGFFSFLGSCGVPHSLMSRYPKGTYNKHQVMRNILEDLDNANNHEVVQNIVSNFYRLNSPIDKDNLDVVKAKLLLRDFRESVGNDPIDRAVKDQERRKKQTEAKQKSEKNRMQIKRLDYLRNQFLALFADNSITSQQRGFELEKIFFELLEIEEFEFAKPYRQTGEQIDGHFKYDTFDYLVEIKWVKGVVKQSDLSIFDGKIRGKAQSTRGMFLAVNGFDDNAVRKYTGDNPRIILMDGQELMIILEGRRTFFDCMKFKVDVLVRYGHIFRKE